MPAEHRLFFGIGQGQDPIRSHIFKRLVNFDAGEEGLLPDLEEDGMVSVRVPGIEEFSVYLSYVDRQTGRVIPLEGVAWGDLDAEVITPDAPEAEAILGQALAILRS